MWIRTTLGMIVNIDRFDSIDFTDDQDQVYAVRCEPGDGENPEPTIANKLTPDECEFVMKDIAAAICSGALYRDIFEILDGYREDKRKNDKNKCD